MQFSRKVLEEAMDVAGVDEDAIREDYSGRGMYGATCVAVVVDSMKDLFTLMGALGWIAGDDDNTDDAVLQLARQTRTDSMGLGIVAYWPDVEFTS